MNNMKDYRGKELLCFLVCNLFIAIYFCNEFRSVLVGQIDKVTELISIILRCSFVFSFFGMVIFVLDVLVPETYKNNFVGMLWGLPGDRIFTDIGDNGDKWGRFTSEDVQRRYKFVYDKMLEKKGKFSENSEWYKIYQKHKDEGSVWNAQRDFLLVRDMCIVLFWMMVLYLLLWYSFCEYSGLSYSWWPLCFYVVEFIGLYCVQHRKAKRFVYNVIANDVYDTGEQICSETCSYFVQVKVIDDSKVGGR